MVQFWYIRLLLLLLTTILFSSTAMSKSYHVMLQGFHWNSYSVTYGWYNIIRDNSKRISNAGITMVWFPPPNKTTSYRPQGYEPTELNDLNNYYGSRDELKDSIQALKSKNIHSIADIVINHRSGTKKWHDFTNPTWSTRTIVLNDEWSGEKSGNWDSGLNTEASRDLDHKNPETQNGIKKWLLYLRHEIGFDGWRYDMTKGYGGFATQMYNDQTNPVISIGEYLDGDIGKIISWIDSSHKNWWQRSSAFDFPLRFKLYDAVQWGRYGDLAKDGKINGVVGHWSDKAVTFLENHDTEEARHGEYMSAFPGGNKTLQGYAYILTHPGTPCVFWSDIFDSSSYDEEIIKQLIWIRKHYAVHSESKVYIAHSQNGSGYAAYIQGDNGEIAVKIGPSFWSPSGKKWDQPGDLLVSGENFAVWGEWGKWW